MFDIIDIFLTILTVFTSTISLKALLDKTISKEDRIVFIAVLIMTVLFYISYIYMRINY